MITQATTANRPVDHKNGELFSNESMTSEKIIAQKSHQRIFLKHKNFCYFKSNYRQS